MKDDHSRSFSNHADLQVFTQSKRGTCLFFNTTFHSNCYAKKIGNEKKQAFSHGLRPLKPTVYEHKKTLCC